MLQNLTNAARTALGKLSLRTKFLLSLALTIAGLTFATLLVVRNTVQSQVWQRVEEDARNATLAFQLMQHQRQLTLNHKADLLATLASMRNGDATAIQDASQDPWQSEDCDLMVLADANGKVVAMHAMSQDLPIEDAQAMLRRSSHRESSFTWWVSEGRIYQVAIQPFYQNPPMNTELLGTVVVGREIDAKRARDLAGISASDMVFRANGKIVLSTFSPFAEHELTSQMQGPAVPKQMRLGEERLFASTVDLMTGARGALTLTVLKSYDKAMATVRTLNRVLLGLGLCGGLVGGALVFVIASTFTRPLANLAAGVRALQSGNFDYPLEAHGGDEVAQVTRAFANMRETLQANENQKQELEEQLRQSQKMDALGRLAGGVAHDFNNLLTVIKGNSDLMLERLNPAAPEHARAQQIQKVADRAAALTRQLLAFSRRQVLQPKVVDMNELIAEMSRLLRRLVREDIEFQLRLGESLGRVKADPSQLEQVLLNLTVNACDAMPHGGRLTIETRNVIADEEYARRHATVEPGEYVLLVVSDTGEGMDAETKARIFEPFFTTKGAGKGTGLGLATVYGVVKQSGGYICVESTPGAGSAFEVYLPVTEARPECLLEESPASVRKRHKGTVLVTEDEAEVRTLTCEFLKSAGYQVLTAQDGEEALAIMQRLGKTVQVLLADVVMPKMGGPELAKRLERLAPDLKVVYMSGYLENGQEHSEVMESPFFLQKPFSRDALLRQVAEAMKNEPMRAWSVTN
jgi:signal transduction histidine kinase/ActR/RegA family two-component response regulator